MEFIGKEIKKTESYIRIITKTAIDENSHIRKDFENEISSDKFKASFIIKTFIYDFLGKNYEINIAINDEIDSSHILKRFCSYDTFEIEAQKIDRSIAVKYIEDILNEAEEFAPSFDIENYAQVKEEIEKNIKGNTR